MATLFLWIKALHVVAVVCWFAGLFYLPRLFVYHSQSTDKTSLERFCVMERKLYRGIMWPAMLATWLLGGYLVSLNTHFYVHSHWLHAKIFFVLLLTVFHLLCGYFRVQLTRNPSRYSHIFFRWFNEAPVVALIVICVLVIVKPTF